MKLDNSQVGAICEDMLKEQARKIREEERARAIRIVARLYGGSAEAQIMAEIMDERIK